ncbi:MAG TPA: DUF4097 family beta strand repeat-containing protein [Gammaproteobacteria bacterium]|nr:DUF4097 family beta strand repeat-containing protein [Gammaproteobacteria bacterium]
MFSFTLAALLGAAGSAAQAQIKVPLSNPSRPVTLEVKIGMGDVHVKAYDGKEVLVAAGDDDNGFNRDNDDDRNGHEREGLHRIPNTSAGLTVEENDNVVTVSTDFSRHHSDLTISVPRQTSVHAKTMGGNGDLTVTGVTGEHELSNINGDVRATDISGTIVAATNNGDIDVSMTAITAGKALSFSSFNGDIEVTLPATVKADVVVTSSQGDVWTDFDVTMQSQPPVVENENGGGGRYRVRMQREMRGTIGGGGPELRFKTFNGDITLRKRK